MILDLSQTEVSRIIIHRVHKKKDDEDHGFPEYSEELFEFGTLELETLVKRISTAFGRSKRFFKLEIARLEDNSFYGNAKRIKGCSLDDFILYSKNISDLLAQSHDRKTIPSGLLLVMEGNFQTKHFVLVIKAELQEAFTIKEKDSHKLVELVQDLFLSPAKDFYKIGYIIEDKNESSPPNNDYSCYMYDDNFSSGKRDLAEYFYSNFLGLTTNRNDKLITKNFHEDMFKFIETNVHGFDDKKGLKNALNCMYRENTSGVINPQEFAEQNLTPELLRIFGTEISNQYPTSFNKDLSLVDRRMQRGQIRLSRDLKIEGPADTIENNVTVQNGHNIDMEILRLSIENGEIEQLITVRTGSK